MCEHHFLGMYSDRRVFLLTYYALILTCQIVSKHPEQIDKCPQLQNKTFGGLDMQTAHSSLLNVLFSFVSLTVLRIPLKSCSS